MPDTDTIEPGSILRRFGFSPDGKPVAAAAAPAGGPASPVEPGSVLRRFGFDADGQPLSPTAKPSPPKATRDSFVEKRAQELAKSGGGFSSSVVEGMPIIGPIVQRGAAAANAALAPVVEAINPNADRGADLPFSDRYSAELDAMRRSDEIYRAAHPVLSIGGNFVGAGALAGPVAGTQLGGRMLGTVGETLGARVYGGLLGGGAIGATDAALRGEDPLHGGVLGAGFGAAGPLAGEALGRAWTAVANAWRGGQGALAALNPVAREWLTSAMANETPASIAAAGQRMGPEGFVADLNPSTTELAAGMASRAEPPASADIGEAYRGRQAQARQVTEDALNRTIGPRTNIEDFRDATTQARAAAADPLYRQWRSMQVDPTPELQGMVPTLERLGLTRDAEEHALMRGIPFTNPATPPTAASGYPTTESWDMIKRAIDARIETAYASGNNTRAADLITLKNRMIGEIRSTPAGAVWDRARAAFADHSELLNQMEAGRDTFLGGRSGTSPDQLREELRGLSLPELQARLVGVRQAADEVMGATRNGDTTLRNKLLAPHNREKLELLLGPQRANDLIQTVEQQSYLAGQAQYVNPRAGSATAPRTQAANRLEAPPLGHWDPSVSRPLSWLPPSWIDALRPSTVIQGGREASYAAARQQLAPVLTSRDIPGFVGAVRAENASRAQVARQADAIRRAATLAVTGPGAELARLLGIGFPTGGVLSSPAR